MVGGATGKAYQLRMDVLSIFHVQFLFENNLSGHRVIEI